MTGDPFEDFLAQLGADLRAADLDLGDGTGWVRLVIGTLRNSAMVAPGSDALTPDELAALQAAPALAVEAVRAIKHWSVRADPSTIRAFMRSEVLYGPVATLEHSPYITRLPAADGSPIGVDGSERLWTLTALIEERCELGGLICRPTMVIPTPYIEVSGQHDHVGTVRYRELVRLYETGADDTRIIEALSVCGFDDRRALFVLRDGIAPPLSDGML